MDFGEPRSYGKRVSAAIPDDLREAIDEAAAEHEVGLSAVVRAWLQAGREVYEREKEGE